MSAASAPWWRRPTPGQQRADANDRHIAAHMSALTTGCHRIAVCGASGGVGKTTVALALGLVLAEVPLARPLLVECLPDGGGMDALLSTANPRGVQDLLDHLTAVERAGIGMVQGFVTMRDRLPILAVPADPHTASQLTTQDYTRVLHLLSIHYNIIILDCGAVSARPLTRFALGAADHLVVVSAPDPVARHRTGTALAFMTGGAVVPDPADADLSPRLRDGPHDLTDCTLVVNGAGDSSLRQAGMCIPRKMESADLNAVVPLPYSVPLRRMIADGSLTVDTLPADYHRAVKSLLVAVLGRLADR